MYRSAESLITANTARFAQPGTVTGLQAGADVPEPKFGGDAVETGTATDLQAAGVLSFNGSKVTNVYVLQPFLAIGGNTVVETNVVELPEVDAKYVISVGKARLATDDEVTAAKAPAKAGK